jgi:adenylate cyclase
MLIVHVRNPQQTSSLEHVSGPLELGRAQGREGVKRLVIDDPCTSRNHVRVEELPTEVIRVENLSLTKQITLGDGTVIHIDSCRELTPPLEFTIGETTVHVEHRTDDNMPLTWLVPVEPPSRRSVARDSLQALDELGDSPAPEMLLSWLESVILLHRAAKDVSEFCQETAAALVRLIGLDAGFVLLFRNGKWTVEASETLSGSGYVSFSQRVVEHVAQQKQAFYQDLQSLPPELQDLAARKSLRGTRAVVVAPIFDMRGEVMGALYGVRSLTSYVKGGRIGQLEAKMVQLFAVAVGSNLTRIGAIRTRVQFEQFFSPELVCQLEQDPNLLTGRKQEVTVLASDLRGFTSLSETLDPQVTSELLQDFMNCLSDQIVEHGGVIIDYAGDGILAMWNAPLQHKDHAAQACGAALAMVDQLPALNQTWQRRIGRPLELGIGLNTGIAHVGNTGSRRKFKYGPHGYTVNLASRVQDATKRLKVPVLLTEATRKQLPDNFETRFAGHVALPGVSTVSELHELIMDTSALRAY